MLRLLFTAKSKLPAIKIITVVAVLLVSLLSGTAQAFQGIVFPVLGSSSYSNDYEAPRANGKHHAIDIIASKGQKIVAARTGTITYVGYPQPSWGYSVFIKGDDGFTYNYIHINNDTPGTDDGRGGPMNAYAADIRRGNKIVKGQLIGWVGDSGNAESTVPHLHFEMVHPNGQTVNPYESLQRAQRIGSPVNYPELASEILPHGVISRRFLSVAMGNVDQDPEDEIIMGAGKDITTPQIKIYNQDKSYVGGISPYPREYNKGVDVATADIDNDGVDEIVVGSGRGYVSEVKIFRTNGTLVASIFTYDVNMKVGMSVAGGDVDGDGTDEVIVGTKEGTGPKVRVFDVNADGSHQVGATFDAYPSEFSSGIDVSVGDVTGDNKEEIITGPLAGRSPNVRVFDQAGVQLSSFFAYDVSYNRGIRVSAGNVRTSTTKAEILTVPVDATAHTKMFNSTGTMLRETWFVEEWWRSSYDVGAGNGKSVGTTGVNRRTTVRLTTLN